MGSKAGFDDDKLFDIAEIDLDDLSSAPATPAAGHLKLYSKNGQAYRVNSAGQEVNLEDLGSAGGERQYSIQCGYSGQGKGKYFAFFKDNPGNQTPFYAPVAGTITMVVVSLKKGQSSQGDIELCKNGSVIHSITMTGIEKKIETGLTLSLAAGDEFCVRGQDVSGVTLSDPAVFVFIN